MWFVCVNQTHAQHPTTFVELLTGAPCMLYLKTDELVESIRFTYHGYYDDFVSTSPRSNDFLHGISGANATLDSPAAHIPATPTTPRRILGFRNAMKSFGMVAVTLCCAAQASAGALHGIRSALMTQHQQQHHSSGSVFGMSHGGSRRGWNVEVREREGGEGVGGREGRISMNNHEISGI